MGEQRRYESEALMADSTSHRHAIPGASEEEIGQRTRNHYPEAVAIPGARRDQNGGSAWLYTTRGTRGE